MCTKPSKFLENLFLSKNEKKRGLLSTKTNEQRTKYILSTWQQIRKVRNTHFGYFFLAFKVRLQENNIIQGGITHWCSSLVEQPTRSAEHSLNSHTCRGNGQQCLVQLFKVLSEKSAFLSNFCRHNFCRQNDKSKNLLSTNNVRQIEALIAVLKFFWFQWRVRISFRYNLYGSSTIHRHQALGPERCCLGVRGGRSYILLLHKQY